MDESKTSVSSSSTVQVRLVHMKLPRLRDENINTQVRQTHSHTGYSVLRRESLLIYISQILKPATNFVDSILLDQRVSEIGVELESSNLLEFNSALSELWEKLEYHRIIPCLVPKMRKDIDKAEEMFDEINIDQVSIHILQHLSRISWDRKAILTMGSFVLQFVRLLEWLLYGPNQSSFELASSMEALKKNPVSIFGTPLEQFQQSIDQLNRLIKITLELIQYICDLTLLTDTEYDKEDLVSVAVHWVILSALAGYVQITLIMNNGEVALELSHLISNLSHILNDLKHHYTICKPQIEEMEAHLQHIAHFEDTFDDMKSSPKIPIEMPKLMKSFMYCKDGHQLLIDGSTMSEVDLEVLNEKAILFLISDLDISTKEINYLLKIYKEVREEDYYKIVWIPFVLKWTEELRQKFENLKSKMPWYIVSYDSPIAGVWYIKGRQNFFRGKPSIFIIDQRHGNQHFYRGNPIDKASFVVNLFIKEAEHFPFKRLYIGRNGAIFASRLPILGSLYLKPHEEDVKQKKPSSGFQGLLAMSRSRGSLNPQKEKVNPAHSTSKTSASSITGNANET